MSGVKSFCSVFFPSWREHHQPKWKSSLKMHMCTVCSILFLGKFLTLWFFLNFSDIHSKYCYFIHLPNSPVLTCPCFFFKEPPFPIPYQVICILLFPSTFLLPSSVFTSLPFPKEPPGFHFPDQIIWPPTISLSVAPHPMHYHDNSTVLHSYFL